MMILIVTIVVAAAVVSGLALADRALHENFVKSAAQFKAAAGAQDDILVTEQDLRDLPEPMARYMRFSEVLGKKRISALRLALGNLQTRCGQVLDADSGRILHHDEEAVVRVVRQNQDGSSPARCRNQRSGDASPS